MEAIYEIHTKCKHKIRYQFKEVQNENDYGNKKYVICVNLEQQDIADYIDVRYHINYNFETFCETYIQNRYGSNLESFALLPNPCPFCGGKAKVVHFGKPGELSVTVRCSICKAQAAPIHKMAHYSLPERTKQVLRDWNRRTERWKRN